MKFKRQIWRKVLRLCVASLVALSTPVADAAELTWTGDGGIFFDDAGNWNPTQSPTAADNLTFDSTASKFSLIVAGTPSANEIRFNSGSYTMEGGAGSTFSTGDVWVDGGTISATGANTAWGSGDDIFVGDSASGMLSVDSGALVTHLGLFLGNSALGNGTVNVDGANSNFGTTTSGSIGRIGVNGTGTINITNGGRSDMSSALIGQFVGSTGTVNVDGAGSDFVTNDFDMRAGNEGNGNINVTGGGRILATGGGNLIAGHVAGSQGQITVTDGIVDVGSRIYVGNAGMGTFTATNSTVNSNLQFILGEQAGGEGTAVIDNTTMSVDNTGHDLIVGRSGLGTMTIQNGSAVSIKNDVFLGLNASSTGNNYLEITGGSSLAFGDGGTDDDFYVGEGGNGTALVNGGSTVTGYQMTAALDEGSSGTVTFDGAGTSGNFEFVYVGNAGTGATTVSGGAHLNLSTASSQAANLYVGDSGNGVGTLNITGVGSMVTSNRRAEIGGSFNESGGTGTVNIQNGGRLDMPGVVLGHSTGSADSDGTLNVDGAGSTWDATGGTSYVGYNGDGRVNVTNGGAATLSALYLGTQANSEVASITVNGASSSLTINGNSYLGDGRAATLTVENGATLTSSGVSEIGSKPSADGAVVTIDAATWNHSGNRIKVGADGGSASAPSTLRVINGGTVNITDDRIMVSDDVAGAHGLLEVIGAGSSVTSAGWSIIGDAGPGTLRVLNGGQFSTLEHFDISGSGTGTVEVSGAGASVSVNDETSIGRSSGSVGTLTLASGGTFTTGSVRIAELAGSTGTVNVNSGGTLAVGGGSMVTVGGSAGTLGGTGTLNVQGGIVDVTTDEVAVTADGTVNLLSGTLRLGSLTRTSGSDFNFTGGKLAMTGNQVLDAAKLADIFNSTPSLNTGMTLEVEGAASLDSALRLNGGTLSVGTIAEAANLDWDAGTFQLHDENLAIDGNGLFGGQVFLNPSQHLQVTQQIINNGRLVTGGTVQTVGGLINNGELVLSNTQVDGTLTSPAGSTITVVGPVNFNGSVSGAGNFYGPGSANFNGGYNPGDSPAIVTFEGDMVLADTNTLFIEIGGNDNSGVIQYDQLLLDGTAMLNGALQVDLIDLGSGIYVPQQGDSFAILSASGGFGGAFSDLNLPSLSGDLSWQLNPGGNTLFLNVIGGVTLDGDFDNDGDLDGADIDSLVFNIAGMTGDPSFDLTGDGNVDAADLQQWLILGGAENLSSGNPYLLGDANLDGNVDGQDFVAWNSAKFTATAAWTAGDFTADGVVDGQDFVTWNSNKFTAADVQGNFAPVPEPGLTAAVLLGLLGLVAQRRR